MQARRQRLNPPLFASALCLTIATAAHAGATEVGSTVAGSAVAGSTVAGSAAEIPIGGTLREATLTGLNGPSRRLSTFRGKPLLINVWASWCGPCRAEMASLERLAWRDGKQYFAIIGISTDDYPDAAKAWLRTANATISHYIDSHLQMENMLGASKLPLTVLVDADGRVLAKVYGAKQWDEADALRFIDATFRK
jgi:thiol-disulfide isomerase/thioredoxin